MEEQEQVQSLQGQVADLKEQVSELMQMMRELAWGKKNYSSINPTNNYTTNNDWDSNPQQC